MINNQLDFVTPRPVWADATDVAGDDVCAHIRDFSIGDVTLEIRREDRMVDLRTVTGQPELVLGLGSELVSVSPEFLTRLAEQCTAAAERFALIV